MKQTRASVRHFEESLFLFLFFRAYCAFDKFDAFSFKISYGLCKMCILIVKEKLNEGMREA